MGRVAAHSSSATPSQTPSASSPRTYDQSRESTTTVAESSNGWTGGPTRDSYIILVVELVRRAVPLTLLPEDDPCKAEFKSLQEKKNEIDMLAQKQVRRILWTGLGFSVVQVGLFFRLTFWEFSWDVMEPIAFFTTTTGIVIGYAYFLFTSRDPSYQDLLKRLFLSRQRKLIKKRNFDIQRFVELQKKFRLPMESCASIKRRTGVELEPEDLLHDH